MKQKLIYILPEFNTETDTHFSHLYGFINDLSDHFDIALVIEKSYSDITFFSTNKIKVLNVNSKVLRSLKLLWIMTQLRVQGYRRIYVHYSYIGALIASVIMRLTGGSVWYWNCGMPWLYGRQLSLRFVLYSVNYLVTGSEIMKQLYAENMNVSVKKIKILPTWIDIAEFRKKMLLPLPEQYRLPENKKIVLFVHRLSKRKGAHMIVPVAKYFADDPSVHFVVAGSGPYEEIIQQEIKEFDLKNITLFGRVPNMYIPALMKKSAVYFMPSEEEGVPRALLEAIVAGVPYVASDIGGVKQISEQYQGGILCESNDVNCLVVSIEKMVKESSQSLDTDLVDQSLAVQEFIKLFK